MNPAQTLGTIYGNLFRVFADPEQRSKAVAVMLERGGVAVLGILITLVGVAFVLANSKAGQAVTGAVGDVAGLVVTKGTSKASAVAKGV